MDKPSNGDWQTLARALVARRALPRPGRWTPMAGGRVNRVWRIDGAGPDPLVCKLESADGASPLFPNDLGAEWVAIRHLAGSGLAPDVTPGLPALVETPLGRCLLYTHVRGRPWRADRDDPAAVAALLSRLHERPVPTGLRRLDVSGPGLVALARPMLAELPGPVAERLCRARPAADVGPPRQIALLHGDPVPSNIIVGPNGLRLIDWQCPAVGDPALDAALFLSPAMQTIYGSGALPASARAAFLAALPAEVAQRTQEIEPLHRWLVAVFCTWRGLRGSDAHARAAPLELAGG